MGYGREGGGVCGLALDCEGGDVGDLGGDFEGERVFFGADQEDLRGAVPDYVGDFGGEGADGFWGGSIGVSCWDALWMGMGGRVVGKGGLTDWHHDSADCQRGQYADDKLVSIRGEQSDEELAGLCQGRRVDQVEELLLQRGGAVEDVEVAELRVSAAVVDDDSIALLRGDLKQLGVEHIVGQAGPQGVRHDAEDEKWYGMNLRVGADGNVRSFI